MRNISLVCCLDAQQFVVHLRSFGSPRHFLLHPLEQVQSLLRLHTCQAIGLQQQWWVSGLAMTGIEATKPSQKHYEKNLPHIIFIPHYSFAIP